MPSYHFTAGNSVIGPIGICARVESPNERIAVERFQEFLGGCIEINIKKHVYADACVESCNVYINPDYFTEADIDEADDGDGNDIVLNADERPCPYSTLQTFIQDIEAVHGEDPQEIPEWPDLLNTYRTAKKALATQTP